jgi:Uncharacterized protein conserved in bacteria
MGKGNLYLTQKNYSNALDSYQKATSYKNNSEVKDKIKTSTELKENKIKYDSAVSLMNTKQYEQAIEIFKTINQFDGSEKKIEECISLICSEKIIQAKNYVSQENFQQAILILQDVLSLNSENAEAKSLIKACNDSMQSKVEEQNRKNLLKTIKGVYKLLVDLESQHVYVYKYNKLLKTMLCSSGMEGYDTPKGKFTITDRGDYFYSDKYGEGAYYWVRFTGVYLFHSIPTDENKNFIKSEADKLGEKASHGCVRLSAEDAKWIYENIPKRISKVLVY